MSYINKQFLKENFLGLSLTLIGVLCLALSAMLYMGHRSFPRFTAASGGALDGADIDLLEQQNKAYERIAQAVTPAIVYIRSEQVVKVQQSPFFMDPFFRQFFGNMFPQFPQEERRHALGSGVIVNPDGYLVTNNHVIQHASTIEVQLRDRRSFKGKVVGADPATDIDVVKINARDLPTAPLGDSSSLRVGDTVMAFGNPYGFNFTVTRGIISALGRPGPVTGETRPLETFIQTDAAINPGNSGGALVNVRGQVIGINTFIVSGNSGPGGEGSFLGLGFAIPSNTVKHVMEDLVKTGKVSRGYLGVRLQPTPLDDKMARQFKLPDTSGALVEDVTPDSPADRAGIKNGDVIRKLDGQKVEDSDQLTSSITSLNPGTTVNLEVFRDGKPMNVKVTLGERPGNLTAQGPTARTPSEGTLRGLSVQNLTPDLRDQFGVPASLRGVVITGVDPNSPAGQVGVQQGVVIQSINRQAVNSVGDFNRLAAEAKGEVLLRIWYNGTGQFIVISPSGGDNGDEGDDGN
jgi:serine protease Do